MWKLRKSASRAPNHCSERVPTYSTKCGNCANRPTKPPSSASQLICGKRCKSAHRGPRPLFRPPKPKQGAFRERSLLCIKRRMRARNYNDSPWLKINSLEIWGKKYVFEFCRAHSYKLRLGRTLPRPCRICGVGTQSATILCRWCGAQRAAQALINTEKRARRLYGKLLAELRLNNIQLKKGSV